MTVVAAPGRRAHWGRRLLGGAALVALLVGAGVIRDTAPTDAEWQGPMEVRGEVAEELTGRNIRATVHGATVAAVATTEEWTGETPGRWIAVETSVEAVETEVGALLGTAELLIDGDRYGASVRPGSDSLEGLPLSLGVPTTGVLLFEVPESVLTEDAELRLAVGSDPRLDSMLVIPLTLRDLEVVDTYRFDRPSWGAAG